MTEDAMQVRLESKAMHLDGRDPGTGKRFSSTAPIHSIVLGFPALVKWGILAEDSDKMKAFDRAIERAETMLRNLRMMKAANLTTNQQL